MPRVRMQIQRKGIRVRDMAKRLEFVLEIGTEEMPSAPLLSAQKELAQMARAALSEQGLSFSDLEVHETPRRLILQVHDLISETEEVHKLLRGPSSHIAFDENGTPTKAALGFAKKAKVDPSALVRKLDQDGNEYVFVEMHTASIQAKALLPQICYNLIKNLQWPNYRSQRWGSTSESFVRPIRWLCALLDNEVIPFSYADVESSNQSFGHRVLGGGAFELSHARDIRERLRAHFVMLEDERAREIHDQIKAFEDAHPDLHVDLPKKTLAEVINLCEWPSVLIGSFAESFLSVPHEIICESMLTNQRYFPIYHKNGELSTQFVIVSNGDKAFSSHIISGNERVVTARLDDAKFFFEEDLKHPLADYVPKLASVVFQEKLGTVLDKAKRMQALARACADEAELADDEVEGASRAALLAKADLVTQAVVEFTSQQGVMGGYYARASHETDTVAQAIAEHYRPRFAGDELPTTTVGKIVALADKLDTICGMFAIDEPPTGSKDPFAQRRSALGVISMLKTLPKLSLIDLIEQSLSSYKAQGLVFDAQSVRAALIDFFQARLISLAKEDGFAIEIIHAIAKTGVVDPCVFFARVRALADAQTDEPEVFRDLAVAFTRASRLAKAQLGCDIDEALLSDPERALLDATRLGRNNVEKALANGEYEQALVALAGLREPIDRFFTDVLVMDEDTSLRTNRLRLLNLFVSAFDKVANIASLSK